MNAISLFSGIGGLDLSVRDISITRLYVEIDPVCRAILSKRMSDGDLPAAPIHADITTLDRAAIKQHVGDTPIDCLVGGKITELCRVDQPPCTTGPRQGRDDCAPSRRSSLEKPFQHLLLATPAKLRCDANMPLPTDS